MRIVAYDVSRAEAVVHADGLGLLPIHFYITFDDFLTVGKCQLAWRCRDDIGVVFERWLDIPPSASSSNIVRVGEDIQRIKALSLALFENRLY